MEIGDIIYRNGNENISYVYANIVPINSSKILLDRRLLYKAMANRLEIYENALSFRNVKNLLEHVISRLGRPVSYRGLSYSDIFPPLIP